MNFWQAAFALLVLLAFGLPLARLCGWLGWPWLACLLPFFFLCALLGWFIWLASFFHL